MNYFTKFGILGIICFITVFFAGCTGTSGPSNPAGNSAVTVVKETPVKVGSIVVNEQQNGATTSLNVSSAITLTLPENGTTGFLWNLTTTPGLQVTSDTFIPSETSGNIAGAGGIRVWVITATRTGEEKIHGIYKRPWEPTVGNETTYTLTVIVGPA